MLDVNLINLMRIGIILDLNLCVIVTLPLCGYLLGTRSSPLGIMLHFTTSSGIGARFPKCADKSLKLR